jgi:hypothetical protein
LISNVFRLEAVEPSICPHWVLGRSLIFGRTRPADLTVWRVRRLDLGEHGFMVSRSGGRLMLRLRGFVDMLGVERLPLLAHVPHSCDCRCFGLEDAGSQARSPGMRPARPDALGSGPSDGPQVRISPGIVSGVGSSRASPSCHWHCSCGVTPESPDVSAASRTPQSRTSSRA